MHAIGVKKLHNTRVFTQLLNSGDGSGEVTIFGFGDWGWGYLGAGRRGTPGWAVEVTGASSFNLFASVAVEGGGETALRRRSWTGSSWRRGGTAGVPDLRKKMVGIGTGSAGEWCRAGAEAAETPPEPEGKAVASALAPPPRLGCGAGVFASSCDGKHGEDAEEISREIDLNHRWLILWTEKSGAGESPPHWSAR